MLPEVQVYSNSYYSVEPLPESPTVALAKISVEGLVASLNSTAIALWGWESGQLVPGVVLNELLNVVPVIYIEDQRGRMVQTTCVSQQDGWLLVGTPSKSIQAFPEKSSIKTLIEKTPVFHHSFASHTPQGILFLDKTGQVLYANQKLKELMRHEDHMISMAASYLQLGFDEGLNNKVRGLLQERYTSIQHNMALTEDIAGHELGVYGTPIFDTSNKILGAILNFEVRHSPAEDLEDFNVEGASSHHMDHMKNVFVAMMSHELRTPLGVMNGYAEILCQELDEFEEVYGKSLPPQIKEFVLAIHENAQRVLGLVNELFDLSNMRQLTLTPMSLHETLQPVIENARVELESKGVQFIAQLADEPLDVFSNPNRLSQIIHNLLSNAVKFTDNGSVTLRTRKQGSSIIIEITDTGIGIAQDYLDELFTPFAQEDMGLNRRFEGAGIGLALVKLLIDLMKGKIEVESEKGIGSTFRIFLPAA